MPLAIGEQEVSFTVVREGQEGSNGTVSDTSHMAPSLESSEEARFL